jgi:lipoate-protein ligase A
MEAMILEHALPDDASARIWKENLLERARDELVVEDPRAAELEAEIDRNDEWAKGFIEKTDARIAELEDGLSSACEYAEKYEAALKRLYDAALDIDVNEMSPTERDWWQTELRAARDAYRGEK